VKCTHCNGSHPDTFYFCTVTGADLAPWEYLVGKPYVERYRLKRLLDTAGRGALFEAETLAGGKKVAVKIIHPSAAREGNAADRFIEEAATTGGLGHPHLPDGVEAGRDEGGAPYIVRRFVKGQSLASRLDREGPLPVDRAVRAATNVLSALTATHAHGLCHLAITPSRIFLTDEDAGLGGGALLMDFGSAALTPAAEVAPYRAPEVTDTNGGGVGADIYAVAASLYEVLTGRPPFGDDAKSAKAVRAEIPEAVDKAIARGLAKDPKERFPDAVSFLEALVAATPAETPAPAPAPAPAAKPAPKPAPKATMLGMTAVSTTPPAKAAAPATDAETDDWGAPSPFAVAPPPAEPAPAPTPGPAAAPAAAPAVAAAPTPTAEPAPPAAEPRERKVARLEPKPKPKPARPAADVSRDRDDVPDFLSQPPVYRRPLVLVGAGIMLVLVVALVFLMSGGGGGTPTASAEGPTVRVVIRSSAPGAVLTVDGSETESNPFESRFAKSDIAHTVRAEAPGYRPREMLVHFDSDREIVLDLTPAEAVAASAAPVPPPLPSTTAPEETAAPATAAAAETAAPATTAPAKVAAAPERTTRTTRTTRTRETTERPAPTKRTRTTTKQQGGGFVTDNPFE
jgi:serine/threonine-protein kinase